VVGFYSAVDKSRTSGDVLVIADLNLHRPVLFHEAGWPAPP
jgi:hypothetical protein